MKFDFNSLQFVDCNFDIDKLAISGSDKDLSWKEFKQEVDKFEQKLIKLSLPKGHPVVIYGHKETKFIIAMIACIKLRLPYIPVDTIYPIERLHKIKDIVKSGIIINCLDNTFQINQNNVETSYNLIDQIIYIIFTSGSTGTPKGVQITKSAINNFQRWIENDFNFSSKSIFMNQAPFSFDLSVYELVGFLSLGGTIILNDRKIVEDYKLFFERLQNYNCNIWVSTPSFITKFLMAKEFNENNFKKLKTFLFCGEVLNSGIAKKIIKNFKGSRLLNSYGPTEATVAISMLEITPSIIEKYSDNLPVGFIKDNTEIRILNGKKENNKIIGEIEIIGNNVSIGYFKNQKLNKQKFGIRNNTRFFKTGDYGYIQDTLLFFIARKDDLIKLHGFRIEIGEIDKAIEKCEGVIKSVTIPLKRGDEVVKLVSFILPKKINLYNIKEKISLKLPYYMIPSDMVSIDQFPYNANDKIDKKVLLDIYKNK